VSEAKTAPQLAKLHFRKGPEKGKTFEVRDELVHIGRGEESNFRLRAKDLQDYELSIVLRNNRYAIYAARGDMISVEGNYLPPEKWVWLPEDATVLIGDKTEFQFEVQMDAADAEPRSGRPVGKAAQPKQTKSVQMKGTPLPAKARNSKGNAEDRKSGQPKGRQRNVAKFITDQVGDPLVQLGEDGHLPELYLEEIDGGPQKKKNGKQKEQKSEANPLLVGIALGFSVLSSLLLLLMSPAGSGSASLDKTSARSEIRQYYGGENEDLEAYQLLLREAALSRSRGDYRDERDYYRRVLQMLVSEDNQGLIRLTDTREGDEKLRDLLSVLLAD
jgi:hypothetical protein